MHTHIQKLVRFITFVRWHWSEPLHWFSSWRGPLWWIQRWSQTAAPRCWLLWRSCWLLLTLLLQTPTHLLWKTKDVISVFIVAYISMCHQFTWQQQDEDSSKDIWVRCQARETHGSIFLKKCRNVATDEVIKCSTPCKRNTGCPWVDIGRKIQ